jgi:hypothetical protein
MTKETILTINLFIFSFLALSINSSVWADSINPGVFSIDSKPYGLTYEQWGVKYWQWSVSLPKDKNPLNDNTGEKCASGQSGPVWFLTGIAGGGSVTRSCTIPNDKAILISVAGNSCSYLENPNYKTESELRNCAINGNRVSSLELTVDGTKIKDLQKYHVTSNLYSENITKNNPWEAPAGPTNAVYDCYCLMLEPMSPGNHTIKFSQTTLDPNTLLPHYAYDVTYLIRVSAPIGS